MTREHNKCLQTRWNKWVLWSNERQVHPFTAPVNQVVEFLSELYQEGLEYRTIDVYRSLIYAYHWMINGSPIGKAKELCLLLVRLITCALRCLNTR